VISLDRYYVNSYSLDYWLDSFISVVSNLNLRDAALVSGWAVFAIFYYRYLFGKIRLAWKKTAGLTGLTVRRRWGEYRLEGAINGMGVTVRGKRRKSLGSWFIQVKAAIQPVHLRVKSRSLKSPVEVALEGFPVLTSDTPFDRALRARGNDEAAVLAVLGAETRRRVMHWIADSGTVLNSDTLEILETEGVVVGNPEGFAERLGDAVKLLSSLDMGKGDVLGRLAANARGDPQASFRVRCLLTLHKKFAKDDRVVQATRDALGDPDPLVRLRAALYFGRTGLESPLKDLMAAGDALYAPGMIPDLIEALTLIGGSFVEDAFILWIGSQAPSVPPVAAKGLGEIGTPKAVEPLRNLAEGKKNSPESRSAAIRAINRIQGRIDPAKHGSLSLAPLTDGEGALSIAPGGGELSLEETEGGEGQ
jgi:hypothetical protein